MRYPTNGLGSYDCRYTSIRPRMTAAFPGTPTTYEIVLSDKPSCNGLPACVVDRILSEPSSIVPAITWVERSRTYAIELYVKYFPADLLTTANSMTTY